MQSAPTDHVTHASTFAVWPGLQVLMQKVVVITGIKALPLSPLELGRSVLLHDWRSIEVRASCSSPDLVLFDNVLPAQECEALIEFSREHMAASHVTGEAIDVVDTAAHSSSSAYFEFGSFCAAQ